MRLSRGASVAELERVYRADLLRFVRVATAIAGEEESGADAVHDAFVQAVRARRSYRREGPLEAWVWRMVVNAAKKKRAQQPDRQSKQSPSRARTDSATQSGPVIAALPERQRLVLFLRYYADLEYEAIAETLDISSGTVGGPSMRLTARFAAH